MYKILVITILASGDHLTGCMTADNILYVQKTISFAANIQVQVLCVCVCVCAVYV